MKRGDKQANKPLHTVGAREKNGSRAKLATGKAEKSESFTKPKIISLRRPWRKKTKQTKKQVEVFQVLCIKNDANAVVGVFAR